MTRIVGGARRLDLGPRYADVEVWVRPPSPAEPGELDTVTAALDARDRDPGRDGAALETTLRWLADDVIRWNLVQQDPVTGDLQPAPVTVLTLLALPAELATAICWAWSGGGPVTVASPGLAAPTLAAALDVVVTTCAEGETA